MRDRIGLFLQFLENLAIYKDSFLDGITWINKIIPHPRFLTRKIIDPSLFVQFELKMILNEFCQAIIAERSRED